MAEFNMHYIFLLSLIPVTSGLRLLKSKGLDPVHSLSEELNHTRSQKGEHDVPGNMQVYSFEREGTSPHLALTRAGANSSRGLKKLVTFDKSPKTTYDFQTLDDTTYGGSSTSSFSLQDGICHWTGMVRPSFEDFLSKFLPPLPPMFCSFQNPGLLQQQANEKPSWPNLKGSSGMVIRARQTFALGLSKYVLQLKTHGAKICEGTFPKGEYWTPKDAPCRQGGYFGSVSLTKTMTDHKVPWSGFKCVWKGKPATFCPDVQTQLADIWNVGIIAIGKEGSFYVELESVSVY